MSASIKASADGLSATIQVGGSDKLTLNTDGSLVATANPATGTRSNALATMQKFADEFGSSLASSGYQKLPSGLIIQWGTGADAGNNVNQTITFPVAFPNAVFTLTATPYRAAQTIDDGYLTVSNISTTGFQTTMSTTGVSFAPKWIAIGY